MPRGRPKKKVELVTLDGVSHSISEWESIKGMVPGQVRSRMSSKGMTVEEAILTPVRRTIPVEEPDNIDRPLSSPQDPRAWKPDMVRYQGQWVTIRRWTSETGLTQAELSERVNKLGWDLHRAIHEPRE